MEKRIFIIVGAILFLLVAVLGFIFVFYLANNIPAEEPLIESNKDFFFSVIMIPDTQKYSAKYPEIFLAQTRWIAENKKKLNIVFVAHVGDLVDSPLDRNQWIRAQKAMRVLSDNNIPFGVSLGNHDYNSVSKRTTLFGEYFSESDFGPVLEQSYLSFGNGFAKMNVRDNLSKFDKNIVFVFASICPKKETLADLNLLIREINSEKIFITHGYLGADGNRYVHVCKSTQYIWDSFIKKSENMNIVLSGHVHDEAIKISKNSFKQEVIQILSDYQDQDGQKSGYLKILTFYPGKNVLEMKTYSPFTNNFFDSNIDRNFSFEIN